MNRLFGEVLTIIPARGGSKSIRNKNIQPLAGKALLAHTIEHALSAPTITRVVVSTDDPDVAAVANRFHAEVIWRPAEISTDAATSESAILHVLDFLQSTEGYEPELVVFLQATSPLRKPEHLEEAIQTLHRAQADSLFSASPVQGFIWRSGAGDLVPVNYNPADRKRRQELSDAILEENGSIYIFKPWVLRELKCRLGGKLAVYHMDRLSSFQIDEPDDLRLVEQLFPLTSGHTIQSAPESGASQPTPEQSSPREDSRKTGKYFGTRRPAELIRYEDSYWVSVVDPDGNVRNRLEERRQYLDDIKQEITILNSLPAGRILDVGCGLGYLLSGLRPGWDRYGVEISCFAATHAKQWGQIHIGTLETAPYPERYFDVVVLYHVIEHVEDPVSLICRVRRILKPGGVLLLGTPDFDSGCARRFGPNYRLLHDHTHIRLFTNDSMHRFLRDHGFVIDRVECPFFETRHFTPENLMRLFDISRVSPPFYGNFMTFYCHKPGNAALTQVIRYLGRTAGVLADLLAPENDRIATRSGDRFPFSPPSARTHGR